MSPHEDTIVARATAPGEGAIAIVRFSGPRSVEIADILLRTKKGDPLAGTESHRMLFGSLVDPITPNKTVDEVLVVKMLAPRTYTGEDQVEVYCHGGTAIVRRVLDLALQYGARLADPGEFTRRAFLNGRIDLVQAEAVADLVAAKTDKARQLAMRQLQGDLSGKITDIRNILLDVAAEIEARIDFPEDEVPPAEREQLAKEMAKGAALVVELIEAGERGRVIRDGARVIIVGRPNTGKSSLFNALLRRERAIVTPHPGTTRDTIESTIDLDGIPLTLIDTAGMHAARDEIEAIGIGRTKDEIHQADLIIVLFDESEEIQPEDRELWEIVKHKNHLVVLNKSDLDARTDVISLRAGLPDLPREDDVIEVSALKRRNLDRLEESILGRLIATEFPGEEGLLVSNLRHINELRAAGTSIHQSLEALGRDESSELVMIDLNEALTHINGILGLEVGDELLDRIFARFCIGK